MALELLGSVAVPPFRDSGFDHGDVHLATGRIFVAHTRAGSVELPGRPRWCVYDRDADRFLVNIAEPACVALLTPEPFGVSGTWPVSAAGPHGLDLDVRGRRAFVACDGGRAVALDLASGREI